MERMVLVLTAVVMAGAAAAAERPVLRGSEAPRATDLLRAEKLAEQARKRLEMPAHPRAGWKRGGTGWGEDTARPAERQDVIINVRPPRRAAR